MKPLPSVGEDTIAEPVDTAGKLQRRVPFDLRAYRRPSFAPTTTSALPSPLMSAISGEE